MGNFIDQIERLYKSDLDFAGGSKLQWLSEFVFDFTAYDSGIEERWGQRMVDVLTAIVEKKPIEYQEMSEGHYEWYLVMVNMPFLAGKLDWGTSIRGAWLDVHGENTYSFVSDQIEVKQSDFEAFIGDLLAWVNKKD